MFLTHRHHLLPELGTYGLTFALGAVWGKEACMIREDMNDLPWCSGATGEDHGMVLRLQFSPIGTAQHRKNQFSLSELSSVSSVVN